MRDQHPTAKALALFQHSPELLSADQRHEVAVHVDRCAECSSDICYVARFDFSTLRALSKPHTSH